MSAGNLGGATFTIQANTDPFVRGLQQAESQARKSGRSIADSLSGAGRGGMGLMVLSQTIDDLQYGFRAIVNNVPQVGMAIGRSFGMGTDEALKFGGAMGIAAVAVNTWVKNWETAKDIFGDTAPFKLAEDAVNSLREATLKYFAEIQSNPMRAAIRAAAGFGGPFADMLPGMGGGGMVKQGQRMQFAKERAEAEAEADREARAATEGLRTEEQKRAARDFGEELAKYQERDPGRLRREMLERRLGFERPDDRGRLRAAMGDIDRGVTPQGAAERKLFARAQAMMTNVDRVIRMGMEGRLGAGQEGGLGGFGAELKRRREDRAQEDRIKAAQKQAGSQRKVEDEMAAAKKKEWDRLGRDAAEKKQADEKAKRDKEHEQREEKRRRDDNRRDMTRARHLRRQVRDAMESARPDRTRSEFMGFAEFAKSTQTGALNNAADIQKRQLEALTKIKELLEDNPDKRATIMAALAAGPR